MLDTTQTCHWIRSSWLPD